MKHYLNWEEGTLHGYLSSALKPALVIESGDRVVFRTLEADWRVGDRFITASDEGDFFPGRKALDRGHALCGPVYIRGADAGTTLEITIRRIRCGSWGWSRFGGGDGDHLRQMAFQGAEYFLYWKLDQDQGICTSHKGHVIRMNPFMGVCAVAPESPGQISTHQPGAMGANLDCKEICEGARLYLPVFVEGALFSMGDGHAAQGDGELGCTAIETPMEEVEVEFKVCDWKQEYPVCRGKDGWITFGFHRDLNKAAYQATREMIKLMQRLYGYEYKEAVAIASLTVDLRITQMVNGVRGVHALLPDQVIRCRESSDCTDNKNLINQPGSTKKKQKLMSLFLTGVMAVSLVACGGSSGSSGSSASSGSQKEAGENQSAGITREKTLIWAVPELPNGADNEFQYTAEAQEMQRNIYDSPLAYGTYYDEATGFILPDYDKIVPSLAESWEMNEDGSVVTLTFRKGVKSHAGNELTADDFIYSWERGFGDAGNKGTFGAQNMGLTSADQIEKIDDYTVKVNMNGPNPIAEAFLAHVCGLLVDSVEYKANATDSDPWALDWASTSASGFGPWKLVEFTPGVRCVLDRFDEYWDQENLPYFERVIILEVPESSNRASMLLSGDVDAATKLSNSEIATLQKDDSVKCLHYDSNKTFIVGINVKNEYLSDPKVRQALGFAVPYQEILDTVYLGQAKQLKSLVCSTYPMSTDQYFKYTYDLDQAKALLAEAGYGDGFTCKITVDNTNVQAEQVALLMQSSLKQIGVNLEIEKIQSGDYYDKLANKDFDGLFAFLDSAGCPDAGFALRLGAYTGSINNMGHYSNGEVDALVDQMMATTDVRVREECAKRIQEIVVWEDPYCLYIAEPGFDLVVAKDIKNPQWDTIQQIHWNAMSRE